MWSRLLISLLLVSGSVYAVPATFVFVNHTHCGIWFGSTRESHTGYAGPDSKESLPYGTYLYFWDAAFPTGVGEFRLAQGYTIQSAKPAVDRSLTFTVKPSIFIPPAQKGQIGYCNGHPIIFDMYPQGTTFVFRVVPLVSTKGVNLK